MTPISRLTIQRLHAEYLISEHQPEPQRVKAQLDEGVCRTLALALPAALSQHFAHDDDSVWLIRRLQIAVDINAHWEAEASGRAWAEQIEQTLAAVLGDSSDGENVLRFPNQAAYLARFLVDAANGSAWGKWHYAAFEGLRLLSTSAILRTAICDRPDDGRDALYQLSSYELNQVLPALNDQDARRLLDHLAAGSVNDSPHLWHTLWSAWESLTLDPMETSGEAHQALRLYLAASRIDPQAGGESLHRAAFALLRLARCLAQGSPRQGEKLLAYLVNKDLAGLYTFAGASDGERLSPLLDCASEWLHQTGQTLLARAQGESAAHPINAQRRHTPLGGIFLLLPLLDELPLAEATLGWPDCGALSALEVLRFLILVKACGSANARRAFHDPLIHVLLGLSSPLSLADLSEWQAAVKPRHRRTLQAALARWQQRRATQEERHHLAARLDKRAEDVAYLALPPSFAIAPALDRTLSLCAQSLLRAFAWRLPGFAASSLPYLHANFLAFDAALEDAPEQRLVRLGKPPLHLVLNMTGMTRATYHLSWLDARQFVLRTE